jgi:hypothetical protein
LRKDFPEMTVPSLDMQKTMANAIRALSMDAVQKANSGHPGLPMGAADFATVLFTQFLNFDASDPHWPDRDRFILSAGHGSKLRNFTLKCWCARTWILLGGIMGLCSVNGKVPAFARPYRVGNAVCGAVGAMRIVPQSSALLEIVAQSIALQ